MLQQPARAKHSAVPRIEEAAGLVVDDLVPSIHFVDPVDLSAQQETRPRIADPDRLRPGERLDRVGLVGQQSPCGAAESDLQGHRPPAGPLGFKRQEQREVVDELLPLAVEDELRRRRHDPGEPVQPRVGAGDEPLQVARRIDRPLLGPDPSHDVGVKRVQFRAARERVEPDVTIGLGFLERVDPEPVLQQVPEGAFGEPLEPRDRHDAAGSPRVEQATGLGHEAIERREQIRLARLLGASPPPQIGKRRQQRRLTQAVGVLVGQPPSAVADGGLGRSRHQRRRLTKRVGQIAEGCRGWPTETERLQQQPRRERVAILTQVAAGIAQRHGACLATDDADRGQA